MGKEVLEQLKKSNQELKNQNDLISRQAAIDAIERNAYRHTYIDQIVDIIKELPSAQPEIIYCRECMHHHYEKDIPYCDRIDYGYGWKDNDFCSKGEKRTE